MDKRFWSILLVIFLIFGGLYAAGQREKPSLPGTSSAAKHVLGNKESKVTLTEYGDYQCNACQGFAATTDAIRRKYAEQVRFEFRNLPLTQIHPNAYVGARAAEAAGLQNKFWEMHDALYEMGKWSQWTTAKNPAPLFESYAKAIGLNVDRFNADIKSEAVNAIINNDIDEFKKTKTDMATPAFFINGERVENTDVIDGQGAPDLKKFSDVIDKALAKNK